MRPSRLDVADQSSERSEQAYSPTVAGALTLSYRDFAQKLFEQAEVHILPFRGWPMSRAQQIRLLFIMACAAVHRRDLRQVISCCEEALSVCFAQEWMVEVAQLTLLCAEAYHDLEMYDAAVSLTTRALSEWCRLPKSTDPGDMSLEIDLRDRLSVDLFLCGLFTDAFETTIIARRLVRYLPSSNQTSLRAAALEWTLALLLRWRGDQQDARGHILTALETYERLGSPSELARARIVVADILLDAMAPLGDGLVRHYDDDLIRAARKQLALALSTIETQRFDLGGRCMASLATIRLNRIVGADENRIAQLTVLRHGAEQRGDLPLLGQVYTALGDEFGAMGEVGIESQRTCYRWALGSANRTQALAYTVWARRGLQKIETSQEQ